MLNIEKFADEIKKQITDGDSIACAVQHLRFNYSNCQLCRACEVDALNWLLQEYKEPLITQEDQKILHNIITAYEVFNKGIPSFTKCKAWEKEGGEPKYFIEIHYPGNRVVTPTFNTEVFKGMELNKEYTLKELGL